MKGVYPSPSVITNPTDLGIQARAGHNLGMDTEHLNGEDNAPENLDLRLQDLFSGDPVARSSTLLLLIPQVFDDPELEEHIIEHLDTAIDSGNYSSLGPASLALILGEIRSLPATHSLLKALACDDEVLVQTAVRALRRIGGPAFEQILEFLEAEDLDPDLSTAAIETLEGIGFHDLPELQSRIEDLLIRNLLDPSVERIRREACALALARLGVQRSGDYISEILERDFPTGNSYLSEAVEILAEHPQGLRCHLEDPIETLTLWFGSSEIPGGNIEPPEVSPKES